MYKKNCPFSQRAIQLIKTNMKKKDKLVLHLESEDFTNKNFKKEFGNEATYPRIYFNDKWMGGFSDIEDKF